VEAIAEDPLLADTKIIAEAWDAAGAYQVGSFGQFRWSDVRPTNTGPNGMVVTAMTCAAFGAGMEECSVPLSLGFPGPAISTACGAATLLQHQLHHLA
jgi:hypothetical protein